MIAASSRCASGKRPDDNARLVTGPPDLVGVGAFAPGDRASCRRGYGDQAFSGRVMDIEQGRLVVRYDDGKKEAITPRLCDKIENPKRD